MAEQLTLNQRVRGSSPRWVIFLFKFLPGLREKWAKSCPKVRVILNLVFVKEGLKWQKLSEVQLENIKQLYICCGYVDMRNRINQVKPVADKYWKWLDELVFDSNSKLGEAVTYSKNQKENLNRFLEYGNFNISNNQAENTIRPFVIGRKNWLFCDTIDGGR